MERLYKEGSAPRWDEEEDWYDDEEVYGEDAVGIPEEELDRMGVSLAPIDLIPIEFSDN